MAFEIEVDNTEVETVKKKKKRSKQSALNRSRGTAIPMRDYGRPRRKGGKVKRSASKKRK